MEKAWDFSNKKWLYWAGVIGFFLCLLSPLGIVLFLIGAVLYVRDRKKPKTQNYHIKRLSEKYMIVVGLIVLAILIVYLVRLALLH